MTSLIKIEWLKIRKYPAFWWMLGIIALTYPGVNYMFYGVYQKLAQKTDAAVMLMKAIIGDPFSFPETWHTVAYLSSVFLMVPAVMVIMLITNEYQYKTHRQNIIDGWSRAQFMTSKLIDVVLITLVVAVMYVAVSLAFGFVASEGTGKIGGQLKYIPLFILQTFAQLSIAFLLGFVLKKAFIALGVFLFYFLILENVIIGIGKFYKTDTGWFLPLEISDRMIPPPAFMGKFDEAAYKASVAAIDQYTMATIGISVLVWAACFLLFKRKDL